MLDPGASELCDEGAQNSDAPDAICRSNCTPKRCGDGIVDHDEGCDGGESNSDVTPDACRPVTCEVAYCGDNIRDAEEVHACFGTEHAFDAGVTPNRLVATDINGDGLVDLAITNSGSDDVSVLLGTVDGTFAPETRLTGTPDPEGVAAGDITGDGHVDLAIANEAADNVTILAGNGDGSFGAPVVVGVGDGPRTVALGHLDDDDQLDLVVASCGSGELTVLRGLASGSAEPVHTIAGTAGQCFVTLGDVNGDGRPDAIAVNRTTNQVSVRFGSDGLAFADEAQVFDVGAAPVMAAVVDLDGDGLPDIAVANSREASVSLLRNIGEGGFAAPQAIPTAAPVEWLAVGLLDDDDRPDIALAHISPADITRISILRGIPGGGFIEAGRPVTRTAGHTFIALAHVDHDGRLDAITTEPFGRGIVVLRGGDGTLGRAVDYDAGAKPELARIADIDRDGFGDIFSVDRETGDVSLRMGIGGGRLGPRQDVVVGEAARDLAVADVNDDGFTDLLLINPDNAELVVLFGGQTGTWSVHARYPMELSANAANFSIALADLDGDGVLDVVIGHTGSPFRLHIRKGLADGSFGAESLFLGIPFSEGGPNNASDIKLADMDADGAIDVVVAGSSMVIAVYPGRGDGTFENRALVTSKDIAELGGKSVGVGDITGNGLNDIVGISSFGLSVAAATAPGRFTLLFATSLQGNSERTVDAVDVNGDGLTDVVYVERSTGHAFVMLGTASGLAPAQRFRTTGQPTALGFGDLDADGVPDVAVLGDTLSVHLSHASGRRQ